MRLNLITTWRLAAAVGLGLLARPAFAQVPSQPACAQPCCPPSSVGSTPPNTVPSTATPSPTPATPSFDRSDASSAVNTALPSDSSLALGGGSVALSDPGYVDSAIPFSRFRLRYDSTYGNNVPDRAEFFYGKCGCFSTLPRNNALFDPKAPGPLQPERRVDSQEAEAALEIAANDRLSAFIEVPYRFLNPEVNRNTDGFSDLKAGFKYAFIADPSQYLTFQLRGYFPTGNARDGLGTDHVSLEPAMLFFQRLTDRLTFDGEFRVWTPVGGTDFAGNVLRYGGALSYLVYNSSCFRVSPVAEVVGWNVLDGQEFDGTSGVLRDANGDTIINGKLGVRFGFGELKGPGFSSSELYVGYGRALTGAVWYEDVIRVEYRLNF